MLAAWCGHEEALKLLIGKKANVNARVGVKLLIILYDCVYQLH